MTRPYDRLEHWRWVRAEPEFRSQLSRYGKTLSAGRRGRPFSNFGPSQLLAHASNSDEAQRLLGAMTNPRTSAIAGVVSPSLRPLLWLELLGLDLELVDSGGPTLDRQTQARLQRLCRSRLAGDRLEDADRQFVRRAFARLDTGVDEVCARAPRRPHFAAGAWDPAPGDAVAFSATGAAQGWAVPIPSTAGFPVIGEVVSANGAEIVFRL